MMAFVLARDFVAGPRLPHTLELGDLGAKSSDGYPDAVKDRPHFLSDRFAGASFQSLPVDQSQKRLCEVRCLDLLDDMNNWAGPKYLIAEGDTYTKSPEDETFPQLDVNYVKLDRLPKFSDGWTT